MARTIEWAELEPRVAQVEAGLASITDDAQAQASECLASMIRAVAPESRPSIRALAVRGSLALARQLHRVGARTASRDVLRDSLAIAGDLDPTTRIELLLQLAEMEVFSLDLGSGLARIHEALAIARVFEHPTDEARACSLLGGLLKDIGLHAAADRHFTRALALLAIRDDPRLRGNVWAMRYPTGFRLAECGEAMADEAYRESLACAAACAPRFRDSMTATAHLNRASTHLQLGRVAQVLEAADRAAACTNVGTNVKWLVDFFRAAAAVRGQGPGGTDEIVEALFRAPRAPSAIFAAETRAILAGMYTAMGDPVRAATCLAAQSAARTEALWSLLQAEQVGAASKDATLALVDRLAVLAGLREDDSGRHGLRSARLALCLARRIGMESSRLAALEQAARLHDIGKFLVPDAIVLKADRLDDLERPLMQDHATLGAAILARGGSALPDASTCETVARHHHERWDGTGYPDRLAGEAIPLEARIVAIADVYDALTRPRAWRPAWTREEARRHVVQGRGTAFDPALVDAFLGLLDDAGADWQSFEAQIEAIDGDTPLGASLAQIDRALGLEA
jgi:HD-GYP domain-containing protein (c-di-GMP phosphodiesterase class II)